MTDVVDLGRDPTGRTHRLVRVGLDIRHASFTVIKKSLAVSNADKLPEA